jgi:hypothetical protein
MTSVSRRAFIGAGVASLAAWPLIGMGEESTQLPLTRDLDGHALVRATGASDIAQVERLGVSRAGRPIDLVSVGRGPRAALIVGAPHANEPIGCATIMRLLARLARDRALRDGSGWEWHFIPAIDIDGVAFNEGWFRGALSLRHYLDGFYRPPFPLQPEYAFPLEVAGYRFEQETPENRCWRRALDHIRPQLQCSLHGADTGGSFFLVSECRPRLCKEFESLPKEFDITLSTVGDSSAELANLGPGVFGFPRPESAIAKAVASGSSGEAAWGAGDSSAGYSEKRFGTFNMVCEIPLWRDARERDPRDSGRTLAQVLDDPIRLIREDAQMLGPALSTFKAQASGDLATALLASVEDSVRSADEAVGELETQRAAREAQRVLSYRDLVQYESWTAMFRTLAMAERLARLTGASDISAVARDRLAKRAGAFQRSARLRPVSLRSSTELQISAILATARALA